MLHTFRRIHLGASVLLAFAGPVSGLALAQVTLVSTRTLNAEVFDFSSSFLAHGGQFDFNAGLTDLLAIQGTPTLVEVALDIHFDIDLSVTNSSGTSERFRYDTPIDILPNLGDCSPYNAGLGSTISSDGEEVNSLVAVGAKLGRSLDWRPAIQGTVFGLEQHSTGVFAVGNFSSAGGRFRHSVAAFRPRR